MTRLHALGMLVLLGAGWGLTVPLIKLATSTGYGHFGLLFWQFVISGTILGVIQGIRRRPFPTTRRALVFCLAIALTGALIPNSVGYQAAAVLPAGIMALTIAVVPMFAFPIALALGIDRFSLRRLTGLVLGACAIGLIVLPGASLSSAAQALWVLIALIAPVFYAMEGNIVAKFGTQGMGPMQVLLGASVIGLALSFPLAMATGQFITPSLTPSVADWAMLGVGSIHAIVYSGYVWLVGRTGAVFAAQVAYLVTGFGVVWSMLLLGERYPPTVWAAFAILMVGLVLVQPRLAPAAPDVEDAPRPT